MRGRESGQPSVELDGAVFRQPPTRALLQPGQEMIASDNVNSVDGLVILQLAPGSSPNDDDSSRLCDVVDPLGSQHASRESSGLAGLVGGLRDPGFVCAPETPLGID